MKKQLTLCLLFVSMVFFLSSCSAVKEASCPTFKAPKQGKTFAFAKKKAKKKRSSKKVITASANTTKQPTNLRQAITPTYNQQDIDQLPSLQAKNIPTNQVLVGKHLTEPILATSEILALDKATPLATTTSSQNTRQTSALAASVVSQQTPVQRSVNRPIVKEEKKLLRKAIKKEAKAIKKQAKKNRQGTAVGTNQLVALLLVIFVGALGIHRFYLGYIGIGIIQLLTLGGFGIWALIDLIRIAIGDLKPYGAEYTDTI